MSNQSLEQQQINSGNYGLESRTRSQLRFGITTNQQQQLEFWNQFTAGSTSTTKQLQYNPSII